MMFVCVIIGARHSRLVSIAIPYHMVIVWSCFIVLACDGCWSCCASEQGASYVRLAGDPSYPPQSPNFDEKIRLIIDH